VIVESAHDVAVEIDDDQSGVGERDDDRSGGEADRSERLVVELERSVQPSQSHGGRVHARRRGLGDPWLSRSVV